MSKLIFMNLFIISQIVSFNLLDVYPQCKPVNYIGFCRAFWAYTIADAFTVASCIHSKTYTESFSPQVLINNITHPSLDYCHHFNFKDALEKGLQYTKDFGIIEKTEAPDESFFSGVKYNKYMNKKVETRLKSYSKISKEKIKEFIYEKSMPVIVLLKNSVELMFNDLSSLEGQPEDESFITLTIVGWEKIENTNYWLALNNFNENWSKSGYTQIPFSHSSIIEYYSFELKENN